MRSATSVWSRRVGGSRGCAARSVRDQLFARESRTYATRGGGGCSRLSKDRPRTRSCTHKLSRMYGIDLAVIHVDINLRAFLPANSLPG
jgi:hypothetical protein